MTGPDERLLLFHRLAEAARPGGAALPPPDEAVGPPRSDADRLAEFEAAFAKAGGVFLVGPAEAALSDLGELLRAEGVTALFFPEADETARRIAEALVPFGPFALTSGEKVRAGEGAVTAGFRTAAGAIAETGTIVETSANGETLLPGLLPEVQVSLLRPAALLDRIEDAVKLFCTDPPRNISFCSGPSRSADIEQTLTVGAHGPKKMIVVAL
jgi:LUD domain